MSSAINKSVEESIDSQTQKNEAVSSSNGTIAMKVRSLVFAGIVNVLDAAGVTSLERPESGYSDITSEAYAAREVSNALKPQIDALQKECDDVEAQIAQLTEERKTVQGELEKQAELLAVTRINRFFDAIHDHLTGNRQLVAQKRERCKNSLVKFATDFSGGTPGREPESYRNWATQMLRNSGHLTEENSALLTRFAALMVGVNGMNYDDVLWIFSAAVSADKVLEIQVLIHNMRSIRTLDKNQVPAFTDLSDKVAEYDATSNIKRGKAEELRSRIEQLMGQK